MQGLCWGLQVMLGILIQLQLLALTVQVHCCPLDLEVPGEVPGDQSGQGSAFSVQLTVGQSFCPSFCRWTPPSFLNPIASFLMSCFACLMLLFCHQLSSNSMSVFCVFACARRHRCPSVAGMLKKHRAYCRICRSEIVKLNLVLRFVPAEFVRFASALFVTIWLSTLCQSFSSDRPTSAHVDTTLLRSTGQICYSERFLWWSTMPASQHIASALIQVFICQV